jgi:hypothetical protein
VSPRHWGPIDGSVVVSLGEPQTCGSAHDGGDVTLAQE